MFLLGGRRWLECNEDGFCKILSMRVFFSGWLLIIDGEGNSSNQCMLLLIVSLALSLVLFTGTF